NSYKNQSMELSNNYSGFYNDEGYFVFKDFQFYGSCILGDGVPPAVPKSTIEHLFSKHKIREDIETNVSKYKQLFEKHLDSEVLELEKEKAKNQEFTESEEEITNEDVETQ